MPEHNNKERELEGLIDPSSSDEAIDAAVDKLRAEIEARTEKVINISQADVLAPTIIGGSATTDEEDGNSSRRKIISISSAASATDSVRGHELVTLRMQKKKAA